MEFATALSHVRPIRSYRNRICAHFRCYICEHEEE